MSIKAYAKSILDSSLYKLTLDGSVLGMRAKVFNIDSGSYDYYDFALSVIKNKEIQSFINRNSKSFESLPLVIEDKQVGDKIERTMMTDEERRLHILIKEFKSTVEAEKILSDIIKIYKSGGTLV